MKLRFDALSALILTQKEFFHVLCRHLSNSVIQVLSQLPITKDS